LKLLVGRREGNVAGKNTSFLRNLRGLSANLDKPGKWPLKWLCWVVYIYGKKNSEVYIQEGWLPPTKRASAVKTRMNGLSCGEKS